MENIFSFEDMHAASALSGSSTEKASFGYISALKIGEHQIETSHGMKIHPLNAPTEEKTVLATLETLRWSGDTNGSMVFQGICCDAVHTALLSAMQAVTAVTMELSYVCFAYESGSNFYEARKGETVKAVLSLERNGSKTAPAVQLSTKPYDANLKYYTFAFQIDPAPQHQNEIHVTLKPQQSVVKKWGHANG